MTAASWMQEVRPGVDVSSAAADETTGRSWQTAVRPRRGRLVVVTGAAGGVGTSVLSLLSAAAVRRTYGGGLRVIVLEMRRDNPQLATFLRPRRAAPLTSTAAEVLTAESLRRLLLRTRPLGVDVLPGEGWTAANHAAWALVLQLALRSYDLVVLDAATAPLPAYVGSCDRLVLVVTTLMRPSLGGLSGRIRQMQQLEGPGRQHIAVLVNQTRNDLGITRAEVARAAAGCPVAGEVPFLPRDVAQAVNDRCLHRLLVHPDIGPALVPVAELCVRAAAAESAHRVQASTGALASRRRDRR